MKNNLLLLLSLVMVNGSILALSETASNSKKNIEFTEEEYMLLDYVYYLLGVPTQADVNALKELCGKTTFRSPKSYDPEKYPHCVDVLNLLKKVNDLRLKHQHEAKDLIQKTNKNKSTNN
jgi:hypothetical protein